MRVSTLLGEGAVLCRLEAKRTEDGIRELLDHLGRENGPVTAEQTHEILVALLKRESRGTTGLGRGIAMPHVKLPFVQDFVVALGISRDGVDFQASDGLPVHVVFLVLSPTDDPYGHLRLMGLIAGIVRQDRFVENMRRCRTPDAAIDRIRTSEQDLFPDE